MSKKDKHDEYRERLKRFRWVQWQIVRRHKGYISFCDERDFDDRGILEKETSKKSQRSLTDF